MDQTQAAASDIHAERAARAVLEARLAEITGSAAWQIMQWVWRARRALAPAGSRRATLVQTGLRVARSALGNGAAQPVPPAAVGVAEHLSRGHYKEVWNEQAQTLAGAKLGVAGYTDEEMFAQQGAHTRDFLMECVGVYPDDVVLEIGAGVGRVGQFLAPICKEWIGADVSENMLAHLRQRLAGFANVRAVALTGYDLSPIASGTVDLVYCTVVFMHLEEWERYKYIAEGMRVLKPGGRMFVDNVNLANDDGWAVFLQHLEAFSPTERPLSIGKTSTPQELAIYFQRAGFVNIQQTEAHTWIRTFGVKPKPAD